MISPFSKQMHKKKEDNILSEIKDKILILTFNKAKKMNGISIDMYRKI